MSHNFKKVLCTLLFVIFISSNSDASELHFVDKVDTKLQAEVLQKVEMFGTDSLLISLVNSGYLDVKYTVSNDTIFLYLGSQYTLRDIIVQSDNSQVLRVDKPFKEENVIGEIQKILDNEVNKGYQFATMTLDSTVKSLLEIDMYCSVNKGPKQIFDSLKFEGLKKTNRSLLYKYFNISDSLVSDSLLQSIEEDAMRIPFVEYIPPLKQELKQGYKSADIIVPFREHNNLLFEGGGGYLSESDLFVWNLMLKFQNLFGSGKEVLFNSQKRDNDNQQLQILYSQPLFLLGNGAIDFGIQTRDYRNNFYEFVLLSSVNTTYKKKILFHFSGMYKSVEQDTTNSYSSAELSFGFSNMLNKWQPESFNRFAYNWKVSYGHRSYSDDTIFVNKENKSFNEARIEITTQLPIKVKRNLHLYTKMKFQSYQTDEALPPIAELYLVGGTNSIRGFKDEQFPSIRNITMTLEPQIQFQTNHLFIFYDAGYIFNRVIAESPGIVESTIYRFGYGTGISLVSRTSSLKISFGWNKELSFDNPRISLQLKTGL